MDPAFAAKAFDTLIVTGPVAVIFAIAVWWQTKGDQALVTPSEDQGGNSVW